MAKAIAPVLEPSSGHPAGRSSARSAGPLGRSMGRPSCALAVRSWQPKMTRSPAQILLTALEAGIGGIVALGKAAPGEKTMLDALVPAHAAGVAALEAGGDLATVVGAVADAAETGAVATIPLLATKGRASYLGERSVGHQDPGATSAALLLRALADTVAAG